MSRRRSNEEVAAIDSFLRENYPSQGADSCADSLKEPVKYIKQRAQNIGLKLDPSIKKAGGKRKGKRPLSEMPRSALESKCRILQNQYDRQTRLRKELRLENIKLIAENRRLRKNEKAVS